MNPFSCVPVFLFAAFVSFLVCPFDAVLLVRILSSSSSLPHLGLVFPYVSSFSLRASILFLSFSSQARMEMMNAAFPHSL